jgi:hypothetical protein
MTGRLLKILLDGHNREEEMGYFFGITSWPEEEEKEENDDDLSPCMRNDLFALKVKATYRLPAAAMLFYILKKSCISLKDLVKQVAYLVKQNVEVTVKLSLRLTKYHTMKIYIHIYIYILLN